MYSGNTFEGNTLEDAVKLIKEKYNIGEVIFVADSGLISHKNINELHSNDVSFIIGARIKNQNKEITDKILDKSDYKKIDSKQHDTIPNNLKCSACKKSQYTINQCLNSKNVRNQENARFLNDYTLKPCIFSADPIYVRYTY